MDLFFEQSQQTEFESVTAKRLIANMMQDLDFADKVVKHLCKRQNNQKIYLKEEICKVIRFRKELTFQLV